LGIRVTTNLQKNTISQLSFEVEVENQNQRFLIQRFLTAKQKDIS